MATSVTPVSGSEAPVAPVAPELVAPPINPIRAAADAARTLIAERAAAAAGTDVTAPEVVAPAPVAPVAPAVQETDEERLAREAAGEPAPEILPAAGEELVVTIDGAREGEQFTIEVSDVETADRLRQLQRAALRGDQAREIRAQAQRMREEAEEFTYTVQLDPAGVLTEALTTVHDQGHLLRYLLTRPGVLEQNEEFLSELLNAPETIALQARLADAERLERRDAVRGQVEETRTLNRNARQLVQAAERSVEALAPDTWTEEQRAQLYRDTLADVRETARAENTPTVDARRVAGLVQRRLKLAGVAPRSVKPVGGNALPAGTTPAVTRGMTPEALMAARTARQAAASAPVGAGSPATTMPKAPAYDPAQKGSAIQQAAAHARRFVSSLRKPT